MKRRSEKQLPEQQEEHAAGRPFWSGTITFGLVSIPVDILAGNRQSRVPLRMLAPDGTPLSRRYYSPKSGREIDNEDLIHGYEWEKGRYVVITDEELERLAPEKSRDIDLRVFVPRNSIPPLFFERAYFLAPARGAVKAYRLLAEIMEKTDRVGIATFVMHGKEHLVAILPQNGILQAETMHFQDEIRTPAEVGLPRHKHLPKATVKQALKLIDKESTDRLSLEEMRDEDSQRMLQFAEKKYARGKDVVESSEAESSKAEVIDIIAQLKKSLAQDGRRGRTGSKSGTTEADGADRSRAELYEQAKALGIEGRSTMSRRQLINAIDKAA
jgi:DNA end-binding protein Ku